MISRSFEPRISSSQIVPVIVLPSLLISGSSGSNVLLTHPASDVDLDEPCLLHLPHFHLTRRQLHRRRVEKSESPIPHSTA